MAWVTNLPPLGNFVTHAARNDRGRLTLSLGDSNHARGKRATALRAPHRGELHLARPDRVEGRRVQRQQPARRDAVVADAVEADGGPVVLDALDGRGAVGQRRNVVAGAGEDVARMHAEAAVGEVAAAREVVEDLVDAVVVAGDRVVARDMPLDVLREDVADRGVVLARVERGLRGMQALEQLHQTSVRIPASRSSRRRLVSSPPPKPTSEPSAPMTRWQGWMIAIGFAP